MPTVEQEIKAQFSKVFVKSDWSLFKRIAESHLERAVFVRKADMDRIEPELRLLARNIEKRLLIGIGTELLLKSVYLRHGFSINLPEKPDKNTDPPFPFTFQQIQGIAQASDKTYMLAMLIDKLAAVPAVGKLAADEQRGLLIAKVFRNKEGHGVVTKHAFDPTNYRDIEKSLVTVYSRAFSET